MTWTLTIENIAGIRTADTIVESGTNAVRASNWQGKSSLLAAIRTVTGVGTPLTEGTESGYVTLETKDTSTTVSLHRQNGQIIREGTPYLIQKYHRSRAELFAFLDERNPIRRAVRNNEPLGDLLTRPLDFENIDEQIADLKREREQVDAELDRAKQAADRLPTLEERKTSLETELRELRQQHEKLPTAGSETSETKREELTNARAEQDRLEQRIDRLERTLERAREKLTNQQEELDDLKINDDEDLEAELATERQKLRKRERDIELLQSVYESNKRILDEDRLDLLTNVSHELLEDTAVCWICGQETTRDDFEAQFDALGNQINTLQDDATRHRNRVEELETRHEERRRAQRRRSDLKSEIRDLKQTVSEHESSLARATEQFEETTERINTLEKEVEQIDDERTDIESEIKYTEAELEDVHDDLQSVEAQAERRDTLSEERDRLTDEIAQLRTRKEEIKQRIRDEFEALMTEIIPQFEVGFEAARLTSEFELIIAREGREASLDALSEGEIELLGIIVALAGYEAFEVSESIPVLMLDQLGSIATDNLGMLVEYVEGRAEHLVLTAYPEDTSFEGHEIDPATWSVVPDDLSSRAVL